MMSDYTRRIICRVLFLTFCLFPTAAVFAWAVSFHLPGSQGRLAANLSLYLGVQVEFEKVIYPQPGVIVLSELKLKDEEFGTVLAEIDSLQIVRDAEGLALQAGQVNVSAPGGPAFWSWLQRNLRRSQADIWQFHAEHVQVQGDNKLYPLADFRAKSFEAGNGTSALVLFRTRNGEDGGEDVQLKLVRNRQASPPSMAWELRTGKSVLPVGLVQVLLPELKKLGPDARFRGMLTVSESTSEDQPGEVLWGCDASGVLDQVSLSHLVKGYSPEMIDCVAKVEIEHAQVRAGRLTSASALVTGGPGQLSGLSILAAAKGLELSAGVPGVQIDPLQMYPFERLGLALGINGRGVLLRGICENSSPGTVLNTMQGPLLRTQEPEHALQPVASLLFLVSPTATTFAPATQEMEQLARVLPLPGNDPR